MRKTMMAALAAMTLFTGTANAMQVLDGTLYKNFDYGFCMGAMNKTHDECVVFMNEQKQKAVDFTVEMKKTYGKNWQAVLDRAGKQDDYEQGYEDGYNAHRDETR